MVNLSLVVDLSLVVNCSSLVECGSLVVVGLGLSDRRRVVIGRRVVVGGGVVVDRSARSGKSVVVDLFVIINPLLGHVGTRLVDIHIVGVAQRGHDDDSMVAGLCSKNVEAFASK